jgi:hypothetical protein
MVISEAVTWLFYYVDDVLEHDGATIPDDGL